MKHILIVVDIQKDFVDGALGHALGLLPAVTVKREAPLRLLMK